MIAACVFFVTLILNNLYGVHSNIQFTCKNTEYCKCLGVTSGVDEILCSNDGGYQNPHFLLDVQPKKFAKIQCHAVANSFSYAQLSDLSIGPLQSIIFKMCPMPQNKSLSHILTSMGVPNVHKLAFQTYNRNIYGGLTRSHLTGLPGVTELVLSNSGLTDLPDDLFMDLGNLTSLDLRSNNVHFSKAIFDSLSKLNYLELGHNDIQELPLEVFRNLRELRQLNLWNNNLKHISKDIFKGLSLLKALDLSSNSIQELEPDVFQYLPSLAILHITSNNISFLPSTLFRYNQNLTSIKLSCNKPQTFTVENWVFANLTFLSNVSLNQCHLNLIPDNFLENSMNITNIDFSYNYLQSLPEDLFQTQIKLKTLSLSHNNISTLSSRLFSMLNNLISLDLSYNKIQNVPTDLFIGLNQLKELNMANNDLQEIDYNAFSRTIDLVTVNFANNNLSFASHSFDDRYGSYSPFKDLMHLEDLDLSNNSFTRIFADWTFSLLTLNRLNLSYNKINDVSFHGNLHFLSSSIIVDLSHNKISRIDLVKAEQLALQSSSDTSQVNKHKPQIILNFNPLHCDCSAYHFLKYVEGTLNPQVHNVIDLIADNLYCESPKNVQGIIVNRIDPKLLVCPLDHPESSTKLCPKECTCEVRIYDTALIVNCSYSNLKRIPPLVDLKTSRLSFTELYIQGNQINSLPDLNHTGYVHVKKLNAEFNNISDLSSTNIPPNLEVLLLAHNNLKYIHNSVFSSLSNKTKLKEMSLGFNPWLCNCRSKDLLLYMQRNYQTVGGLHNITCFGKKWSQLSINELCPFQDTAVIAISVVIAVLGLLIGILASLYYYYQQEIKVWLFAHNLCLWFVTEEELDKDKEFDAFISYSHKDEDFVTEHLVPNLEGGETPFKLCLHYRDWIAGEWIPAQIARSVEDSKRTVVILSSNFLESVWGKMEFRTAHNNALTEGRARVIIIIYGNIGPLDNLDSELKAYLSTNTYLEWGDPWFWDKLRYALPHPPKFIKTKTSTNTNIRSKMLEDKVDLIHPVCKNNSLNSPVIQNSDIKLNGIVNGAFFTSTLNGSAKQSDV